MILLIFRGLAPLIQRSQSRPMWTILVVIVIYQTSLQYETLKHSWKSPCKTWEIFLSPFRRDKLDTSAQPHHPMEKFCAFCIGPMILVALEPVTLGFDVLLSPSLLESECQHGALLWKPRDLPLVQFHSAPEPKWTKGAEHGKISCDSILYLYHPELKRRSNININLDVYIYIYIHIQYI